jgi:hypothetical protein
LTYNQSLKDSTTNIVVRDILYRWNFAWDGVPAEDAYGYPILQGYQRFVARRNITFPKQIRWERIMPIGSLSFQVYGYIPLIVNSEAEYLKPIPPAIAGNSNIEWSMTLLVSED